MKGARIFILLSLVVTISTCGAWAGEPKVVGSVPANGATGIPTDAGRIIIRFDQNMKMNSWSLMTSPKGHFPPMHAVEEPWVDPVTFEMKIKPLQPNTTYAIQLNSPSKKGFQSARDQTPLPVTTIVFSTALETGAKGPPAPSTGGGTPSAAPSRPLPDDAKALQAHSSAQPEIRSGWQFSVTRSKGLKGVVIYSSGEEEPFHFYQKIELVDEVVQSGGGGINEVKRQITSARQHNLDPKSGQMTPVGLSGADSTFRIVHSPAGNMLYNAATGEEIWDDELVENFGSPLISKLWPDGPLSEGQTWRYQGAEVTQRVALFEAKGGKMELRVERIATEPTTGLATAQIRGRLTTTIDLDDLKLRYDAVVEVDLPLAMGVPFMTRFSGPLTGRGTERDERGQPVEVQLKGEGDALQICKPGEAVLASVRGGAGAGSPTDTRGAVTLPLGDHQSPSTFDSNRVEPGTDSRLNGNRGGAPPQPPPASFPPGRGVGPDRSKPDRGTMLKLHQEPYQAAFHLLIPQGWKADGGMIPSGLEWNVVDLVEHNIRFRATSPDGKSFFGWYPRFYFQDPAVIARSSIGVLHPQVGGVLNGCWLYPYMDLAQYVQTIVFGRMSTHEFQDPRILGAAAPSPELQPWVPKVASRAQAGYVDFQCHVNGIPSHGRIYTIIYEIQNTIWSTVGTFGWVAPEDRWRTDARTMELCIRSFRLNPQWVQRASAAERARGKKFGAVMDEMHRIDDEINRSRSQTRSDMQEEFYKVITEQIETVDPQTGQKAWLPMYNHAWTDGRGGYFVRDYDDGTLPVDNATEWRKLSVINRNDPAYRPED